MEAAVLPPEKATWRGTGRVTLFVICCSDIEMWLELGAGAVLRHVCDFYDQLRLEQT